LPEWFLNGRREGVKNPFWTALLTRFLSVIRLERTYGKAGKVRAEIFLIFFQSVIAEAV
jgi:hypothetical protein